MAEQKSSDDNVESFTPEQIRQGISKYVHDRIQAVKKLSPYHYWRLSEISNYPPTKESELLITGAEQMSKKNTTDQRDPFVYYPPLQVAGHLSRLHTDFADLDRSQIVYPLTPEGKAFIDDQRERRKADGSSSKSTAQEQFDISEVYLLTKTLIDDDKKSPEQSVIKTRKREMKEAEKEKASAQKAARKASAQKAGRKATGQKVARAPRAPASLAENYKRAWDHFVKYMSTDPNSSATRDMSTTQFGVKDKYTTSVSKVPSGGRQVEGRGFPRPVVGGHMLPIVLGGGTVNKLGDHANNARKFTDFLEERLKEDPTREGILFQHFGNATTRDVIAAIRDALDEGRGADKQQPQLPQQVQQRKRRPSNVPVEDYLPGNLALNIETGGSRRGSFSSSGGSRRGSLSSAGGSRRGSVTSTSGPLPQRQRPRREQRVEQLAQPFTPQPRQPFGQQQPIPSPRRAPTPRGAMPRLEPSPQVSSRGPQAFGAGSPTGVRRGSGFGSSLMSQGSSPRGSSQGSSQGFSQGSQDFFRSPTGSRGSPSTQGSERFLDEQFGEVDFNAIQDSDFVGSQNLDPRGFN